MNRVRLTNDMRTRLAGGPADLCDESETLFGHFLTPDAYARLVHLSQVPPTTPEERAAAYHEYKAGLCLTTEQVYARLVEVGREWEARK